MVEQKEDNIVNNIANVNTWHRNSDRFCLSTTVVDEKPLSITAFNNPPLLKTPAEGITPSGEWGWAAPTHPTPSP
jgi:hypothetical protein